jgi:predicted unusual protein kinase regulating ubiquinone biosynthesis (AarF/ABC1/UbiB family)
MIPLRMGAGLSDHSDTTQVCARCLSLRSLWVKFGQYLGGRADLTPPAWTAALQTLQVTP